MQIPELVRTARRGAGLSQRALAARAGVAASTLSRVESGSVPPSLDLLDRLLAGCGKDAVWTLVDRHADLDAELDRCARLAPLDRLSSVGIVTWLFVEQLAALDVLLGGAWAASLHGIPHEGDVGVLWSSADDDALEALAGLLLRQIALLYVDGELTSPRVAPRHLRGEALWLLRNVGHLRTRLVEPLQDWPREVRVDAGPGVRLRVVAPEDLGLGDGVRPEVLARWLARRDRQT